jgi:hypothetical protein
MFWRLFTAALIGRRDAHFLSLPISNYQRNPDSATDNGLVFHLLSYGISTR